jgi:twitching motility protein PilT
VLQGVVAQQLLPRIPKGRCLVQEILRITPAIRNLIREDKVHQIYSQMQIGQEETGMNTMNQHIKKQLDAGLISTETAMTYSNNPEELTRMLGLENKPKSRLK